MTGVVVELVWEVLVGLLSASLRESGARSGHHAFRRAFEPFGDRPHVRGGSAMWWVGYDIEGWVEHRGGRVVLSALVRPTALWIPQAPGTRFGSDRVPSSASLLRTLPTPTTTFDHGFIPTTKGQESAFATLGVFTRALNSAKDNCGIPPAQIAFGSPNILLMMVPVHFPPLYEDKPPARTYPGHDGRRSRLR